MKEKVKKEALIIILVFSALLILFLVTGISQKGGSYAVVTVNGEFFGNYPLSKDADIPIIKEGIEINHLVIENGSVYMKEASCKNHICISMGRKKAKGESIVCLPNRLVIRIEGGNEEKGYDVITD